MDAISELDKIKLKLNKVLVKSFFAHHPNCNQYSHHVFNLGDWRFCVGCTGLYGGILLMLLLDLLLLSNFLPESYVIRVGLGLFFFIPAVIQLFWKSRIKPIKLLMRLSLGFATYFFISSIIVAPNFIIQIIMSIFFVTSVYLYSQNQGSKQLLECYNCKLGEEYETCLIRYDDILSVEGIEKLDGEDKVVTKILELRRLKDDKAPTNS